MFSSWKQARREMSGGRTVVLVHGKLRVSAALQNLRCETFLCRLDLDVRRNFKSQKNHQWPKQPFLRLRIHISFKLSMFSVLKHDIQHVTILCLFCIYIRANIHLYQSQLTDQMGELN